MCAGSLTSRLKAASHRIR